jgi:lysine 2,3-aminomutase
LHRNFSDRPFWKDIPSFRDISEAEFIDWRFQTRNTVTSFRGLKEMVGEIANDAFLEDVRQGLDLAPMPIRLTPYVISLIDWQYPYTDPVRIQFLPVASSRISDHPKLTLDSLHEMDDSPTPGLVHRYPDKALFLPVESCPVFCRFCTRSYAIGTDTSMVTKTKHGCGAGHWQDVFAYVAAHEEIEDIVISGGDTYLLTPSRLQGISRMLLGIPHIRRIRFASKGPSVMPMKILTDGEWTDALIAAAAEGRRQNKEVCFHTHFNTVNVITDITRKAMNLLFRNGVKVRNQSVLIRGVNDDPESMLSLVKQLSFMNVQPYYVYQHDMVCGVEELRTRVSETIEMEKNIRGATSGFNTPTFVIDAPGGGGKRDVHSYEYYNESTGISIYRSPLVDAEAAYIYFDPIHLLKQEGRRRWREEDHELIVRESLEEAGLEEKKLVYN